MLHRAPLKEQEEMEEKKMVEETKEEDKGGCSNYGGAKMI